MEIVPVAKELAEPTPVTFKAPNVILFDSIFDLLTEEDGPNVMQQILN